jgi:hypothetical protein
MCVSVCVYIYVYIYTRDSRVTLCVFFYVHINVWPILIYAALFEPLCILVSACTYA